MAKVQGPIQETRHGFSVMAEILFDAFCVIVSLLGAAALVMCVRRWNILNGYPWLARSSDAIPRSSFVVETPGHYCLATIGFRITNSGPKIRVSRSGVPVKTKPVDLPFSFRRHGNICYEYVTFEIKEPGTYEVHVTRSANARHSRSSVPFGLTFSRPVEGNIEFGIRRGVRTEDLVKNVALLVIGLAFSQVGIFMYFRMI